MRRGVEAWGIRRRACATCRRDAAHAAPSAAALKEARSSTRAAEGRAASLSSPSCLRAASHRVSGGGRRRPSGGGCAPGRKVDRTGAGARPSRGVCGQGGLFNFKFNLFN